MDLAGDRRMVWDLTVMLVFADSLELLFPTCAVMQDAAGRASPFGPGGLLTIL
jgi:hypothetical protein